MFLVWSDSVCYFNVQDMYEEGDDNMRRTIANAMIDARSGKTAGSMRGLP